MNYCSTSLHILIWVLLSTLLKAQEKPNIIFILTDDQRFDAIGYSGNDYAYTPAMDQLAKEGTFFSKAMVTTPICSASRASILTGLYERAHNYTFHASGVRDQYMEQSYPRWLKIHGYRTAFFGKFGVRYENLDQLFDEYETYDRNGSYSDRRGYYYKTIDGDTVHLTRYTGQQAIDYIDKYNTPYQPFCLSLSFSAPHAHDSAEEQYFWQEESAKLLSSEEITPPSLSENKYFDAQPAFIREGFNRTRWKWRYDTPLKYQKSVKGYYRMIYGIDREIAKIRKKLKEKGLDKNTIIILMGDNGYFLGERQLAGKWLMYDNSVRVPLIVYDPRVDHQKDSEQLALNIDIPSTIADIAGIEPPEHWQGKSLIPIVNGTSTSLDRDTALIEHLWEFEHIQPSEGIRTKDWKYFRYINNKSIEELYDLSTDEKEMHNLAYDPIHRKKLLEFRTKTNLEVRKFSNEYREGPISLTVEFIRSTQDVLITDKLPEYGWIVPQASKFQNAYQILVASSQEIIDSNIGDVWNSGRVETDQSINIEHGGEALREGHTYYWKVRIWDEANRLVDYSESQKFTMGPSENMITTGNKFLIERISPKRTKIVNRGIQYDFGKAAFATLEFNYTAPEADTLIIHLGEKLAGGKIDRNPGGHIRYQKIKTAVSKGTHFYQVAVHKDERNTLPNKAVALPDSFPVLVPFRYAEIEGKENLIDRVQQVAYFNYWENSTSYFSSSDTILNKVWDLCKYSIKATTFAGLYVDGDRERIPYEADAYLNQLSHYTTDREYAMARRTIEYFMEYPTWPTEWQQHVALMMYADYMYTGNTELIEKYYEKLKHKSLYELRREDGLISSEKATPEFMAKLGFKDPNAKLRDIVDWPPAGWGGDPNVMGERDGFVFKPISTVINALYYRNMVIMEEFAALLGKADEAEHFSYLAALAKKSINEKLLDKERGIYVDGEGTDHAALHSNMMPLAFGLVPDSYRSSVIDHIKSRGMAASVYGAQYLLDALYDANASDYALDLLTATHDRSWYNMIKVGATISMEAWDMKYKPNADWNHAWGAAPANIIPRGLWGIKPKTPGFGIATIQPQMSKLERSQIIVPTIRGQIRGYYQRINDRSQQYIIEIPANMIAEFHVSGEIKGAITLNNQLINGPVQPITLKPGTNSIKIKINSF